MTVLISGHWTSSLYLIVLFLILHDSPSNTANASPIAAKSTEVATVKKRALDDLEGDDFTMRKRALDLMEGDGFGFEKRALDNLEGDDFAGLKRRRRALDGLEGVGFGGFDKRALDMLEGDDFGLKRKRSHGARGGASQTGAGMLLVEQPEAPQDDEQQLRRALMERLYLVRTPATSRINENKGQNLLYFGGGHFLRPSASIAKRALDALEGNSFGF